MNALLTKVDNKCQRKFEVFHDLDSSMMRDKDIDEKIAEALENGDLEYFGVERSKVCACCCMYSVEESLWGILAASPEEALDHYLQGGY